MAKRRTWWGNPALRQAIALTEGVGAYAFVNAEAEALAARFTTPPTNARKLLIDTLVGSLKAAGIWSKLDALYILAAADTQAARRNWIADAFNLTAFNSPTFTADRGYAGNASSSYLDTNFNPATAVGPHFTQNSAHVSAWDRTASAAGDRSIIGGRQGTTNYIEINPRFTGDVLVGRINNSAVAAFYANANAQGHLLVNRSASTATQAYRNGSSLAARTDSSVAPPDVSITLLARNVAPGSPDAYGADQIAVGSLGSSLTAGEALAFHDALNTYLQAVGAA